MRPVIIKAYGGFSPASDETLEAVQAVLRDWFIDEDSAELKGDLLSIGYEGDAFPDEDIVEALKPFFCEKTWGKLDYIDLEAWTLRRYTHFLQIRWNGKFAIRSDFIYVVIFTDIYTSVLFFHNLRFSIGIRAVWLMLLFLFFFL